MTGTKGPRTTSVLTSIYSGALSAVIAVTLKFNRILQVKYCSPTHGHRGSFLLEANLIRTSIRSIGYNSPYPSPLASSRLIPFNGTIMIELWISSQFHGTISALGAWRGWAFSSSSKNKLSHTRYSFTNQSVLSAWRCEAGGPLRFA